ncbi:MAG: hypothetical protein A2X84_09030 [Desulfuromonadaceae bacterium GWC2_58_13]|nr:MAG: hypothetical protein A2X84_09030 [Desulfuromonadaceae bacterium GWC2_58_13]
MPQNLKKRFLFLGGIPVFDYMISVRLSEIQQAAENNVLIIGDRVLLPVGAVFKVRATGLAEAFYINPLANGELQTLQDTTYCALTFGGKHPESRKNTSLRADLATIVAELKEQFPETIRGESDLKIIAVGEPAEIVLGGNNKNIIEEIHTLFASPQLSGLVEGCSFEHIFFFDTQNPGFEMVRDLYDRLGVSMGDPKEMHVAGLVPRTGYVFTIQNEAGKNLDRIILANRTNEEIIPKGQVNERYAKLQKSLRGDRSLPETHLVINSMTNQEELRLLVRALKTAHASGVRSYLCPTLTLLNAMERLVDASYYTVEREHFFSFRKDFLENVIIPYVEYIICNKDELTLLDDTAGKRGIDEAASLLSSRMNRGKRTGSEDGGKVIVTGGSKGGRYTERLDPERATNFWQKAELPTGRAVRFAERRIVCGDDYVTHLTSTLGAGDVFSGIFIGLIALGWDGGHVLRAATLGAQHFIQYRSKPTIDHMIAVDEEHARMGTETELADVISHHLDDSGDPTRYGTISDTVITVRTTQIQHPFREILGLALKFGESRPAENF